MNDQMKPELGGGWQCIVQGGGVEIRKGKYHINHSTGSLLHWFNEPIISSNLVSGRADSPLEDIIGFRRAKPMY